MKKNITLYGIGNHECFSYYIFDKKQEVVEVLSKILWEVLGLYYSLEETNNKGVPTGKTIHIEKHKDFYQSIFRSGSEEYAGIFYGNKKIFLIIYCNQKLRLKFTNELSKISKIFKSTKIS